MARAGNPYHNTVMESFLKTVKHEVYLWEYGRYQGIAARLPYFLQGVYNPQKASLSRWPPVAHALEEVLVSQDAKGIARAS